MQKRSSFVPYFLIFLIFSIIIFGLSSTGLLRPIEPVFRTILSPIQEATYNGYAFITSFSINPKITELENQNVVLTKNLINQDKLIEDNKALRDQFETKNPISTNLIPARVVGAPGFIPGITVPENYTIDKGEVDGIKVGDAVISKDNLAGRVIKTTQFLSNVQTITNVSSSFTAKTLETNALGVVKGQGGGALILDNVVLSDNLKLGDIVLSKGDVDSSGNGFVPDLVIGEIIAVSKNPSDLFQRAKIKSHVDFSRIDKVFVVSF